MNAFEGVKRECHQSRENFNYNDYNNAWQEIWKTKAIIEKN